MSNRDIRLRNFDKIIENDIDGNLTVSLSKVVEKLILYDTFIIESTRLKEIPILINQIGYEPTISLLKSGVIQIHNDKLAIASINRDLMHLIGYSRFKAYGTDPHHLFETNIKEIKEDCNLTNKKFTILEQELSSVVHSYPKKSFLELENNFISDINPYSNYFRQSIKVKVKNALGIELDPINIEVNTERFKDDLFRHQSNLKELLGIDKKVEYQIIDDALLSIGGLNEKIIQMGIYNCLTGFKYNEVSIFQGKLQFLEDKLNTVDQARQFHRLVTIAGLPQLDDETVKEGVDFEQLLEIRKEDEIVNFRNWLNTSTTFTDEELDDKLNGFKVKLSKYLRSDWGKVVKFIVSNGIGISNPVAGIALGAADTFLLEKFIKTPGAIAFLHNSYPTIFQNQD